MRDIPTSIPDLVEKGLIPVIVKAYAEWIPPEENYLKDILLGMNAIVLHRKGCDIVDEKGVIFSILQTPLKDEYGLALNSVHSEPCEDSARQLLSLYSQADTLRPAISSCLRNYFLGLEKKSEIYIQLLVENFREGKTMESDTEKEEFLEKCGKYLYLLRNITNLVYYLTQNEGSADHKKLLNSLNEDCILVKSILKLVDSVTILCLYANSLKKSINNLSLILK
jgi:hypothetical protein